MVGAPAHLSGRRASKDMRCDLGGSAVAQAAGALTYEHVVLPRAHSTGSQPVGQGHLPPYGRKTPRDLGGEDRRGEFRLY